MSLALDVTRGERYQPVGSHRDASGAVVDITGWTIVLTVRRKAETADPPIFEKTATIVTGPAGVYAFTFSSADTKTLAVYPYACDIWRTDINFEHVMATGFFTVSLGVRHVP